MNQFINRSNPSVETNVDANCDGYKDKHTYPGSGVAQLIDDMVTDGFYNALLPYSANILQCWSSFQGQQFTINGSF